MSKSERGGKGAMTGLLLAATVLSVTWLPGEARASTCRMIIYYSDASMIRPVGSWSNCPGQKGLQGRRTKFSESDTEVIRDPQPGPGSLPCEFLEAGCSNLPVKHH